MDIRLGVFIVHSMNRLTLDLRNNLIHPKESLSSASLNKGKAKLVNDTVKEAIKYLNNKTLKAKSII